MKKTAINLEKSLAELENLVTELERGDVGLEDALKRFERGIALTRQCQAALREAEQKVEILLGGKTVAFTPHPSEPSEDSDASE